MLQGIRAFVFDFDGTLAIPNIDFALMRQRVNAIVALIKWRELAARHHARQSTLPVS